MKFGIEKNYAFVVDTTAVQLALKHLVKNVLFESKAKTFERAKQLIRKFSAKINNLEVRAEFEVILAKSFRRWYETFAGRLLALGGALAIVNGILGKRGQSDNLDRLQLAKNIVYHGVPANIAPETYAKQVRAELRQVITELSNAEVKTPKGSLRNRAEIHTRYETQQNELKALIADGVEYVWASSHADASERCTPWQGRLYSLNGTSGTLDGNSFVPLEEAMQGTKGDGNGLLGYNCRHRLIPYTRNSQPPTDYTSEELRRERTIDKEQRNRERNIRKTKEKAFLLQGIDSKKSKELFAKAREKTREYENFSKENSRAFYPYRTQVMRSEIKLIESR
jgi:hypothetical protein